MVNIVDCSRQTRPPQFYECTHHVHLVCYAVGFRNGHLDVVVSVRYSHVFRYVATMDDVWVEREGAGVAYGKQRG